MTSEQRPRTIEEKLRAVAEHETAQATMIKNWFLPDEPAETLSSLCIRAAEALSALTRERAEIDPENATLVSLLAEAIGKADGIDTLRIQRSEYAKHARAALSALQSFYISSALVSDPRNVRDNEVRGESPADAAPEAGERPAQDKRGP